MEVKNMQRDTYVYATDREDVRALRDRLAEISVREANALWRLAWRMVDHGCNPSNIQKVREEAHTLFNCGCGSPDLLLQPFTTWEYAFRC
jgi:hypothetical protein